MNAKPPVRAKKSAELSRRSLIRWAAAGAVTSIVPFGYATSDTDWMSVESFDVRIPQWEAKPIRVAVLSDMHVNRERQAELAVAAADAAIDENPDLILLPGDFLNFSDSLRISYLDQVLAAFQRAKCPVFATLGNHDWSVANIRKVIDAFRHSNVRLLQNEIVDLDGYAVAGLDDALARRHRPEILVPGQHAPSIITMLHEPDFVEEIPSHVSLMVSGHSHGGQICLPGGIPLHSPFGAKKYVEGFYPAAKVPLFVTRGVGVTGLPFRLFCRPQVAILTLSGS